MRRFATDSNGSARISALFFAISLGLAACVDKIDAPLTELPEAVVVVQGKFLFADPGKVTANVYVSFPASGNIIQPIGGAKVEILDEMGKALRLNAVSPLGSYEQLVFPNDPAFPVAFGNKYRLSVLLPNGSRYLSDWDELLEPIKPDSIHLSFAQRERKNSNGFTVLDTFALFGLSTKLRSPGGGEKARFRWELEQGFKLTDNPGKTCYVVRSLLSENVFAFNGANASTEQLQNLPLTETPADYRFAEGFYFIALQQRISDNAFGYFNELSILLDKKGTLFDPPVGEIRTNMSGPAGSDVPVYGFFYVASQDTVWRYVLPQEAWLPKKYCPLPPVQGEAPRPTACDDCLLEKGAGLSKPSWWEH